MTRTIQGAGLLTALVFALAEAPVYGQTVVKLDQSTRGGKISADSAAVTQQQGRVDGRLESRIDTRLQSRIEVETRRGKYGETIKQR